MIESANERLAQDWRFQLDHMNRMLGHAATKGYYLFAMHPAVSEADPRFLHPYVSGGFGRFLDTWCRRNKQPVPLKLVVWGDSPEDAREWIASGAPRITPTTFTVLEVPRRKDLAPITAALMLVAKTVLKKGEDKKKVRPSSNFLDHIHAQGHDKFQGRGIDVFKVVMGVLEMPPHRAILTGVPQ